MGLPVITRTASTNNSPAAVGAIMGFVFGMRHTRPSPPKTQSLTKGFYTGTVNIFRYGAGPNGIMRTLGQYMAGSGATFGFVTPQERKEKKYKDVC